MNVLSLFDGMSCGQIALNRAGIKYDKYFASEIDKYAIKVTQANYPDTIQLGDIRNVYGKDLPKIDLLTGGSPCQGFSFSGKQLNFDDPRSKLFFEFVRLLDETKPRYFLLENVKMKKEYQNTISDYLNIEPIEINSSLVSAQNRKRLYWTNIPNVDQPQDKGIMLKDILEDGSNKVGAYRGRYLVDGKRQDGKMKTAGLTTQRLEIREDHNSNCLTTVQKDNVVVLDSHKSNSGLKCVGGIDKNKRWLDDGKTLQRNFSQGERIYSSEGKCPTLSASSGGTAGVGNALINIRDKSKCVRAGGRLSYDRHEWDSIDNNHTRKLSTLECERLQTISDHYTDHVSKTQRHRMLGNGWTVDVIVHIFSHIK